MGETKMITVRLDSEKLKTLKHIAVDEDKNINQILLELIEEYIKKHSKKNK